MAIIKKAVPSMLPENDNVIVVVDEIGKMECFSGLFRQTLMNILEATNTISEVKRWMRIDSEFWVTPGSKWDDSGWPAATERRQLHLKRHSNRG